MQTNLISQKPVLLITALLILSIPCFTNFENQLNLRQYWFQAFDLCYWASLSVQQQVINENRFNALTAVGAHMTLTLSNARRIFPSMANPLAVKGLSIDMNC